MVEGLIDHRPFLKDDSHKSVALAFIVGQEQYPVYGLPLIVDSFARFS